MWVKICANTSVEDALAAARFGADAVGFVFAASKRQVTADQVRAIADALPAGLERVGVFANMNADEIAATLEAANLNTAQLHGGLDLPLARELRQRLPHLDILHTVEWTVGDDQGSAQRVGAQFAELAAAEPNARVLVDAKVGQASGGTGVAFDWARARDVLASQPGLRVIVAGGLGVDSVAAAIAALAPWGVDVASGVELRAGVKDHARVERFVANAKQKEIPAR